MIVETTERDACSDAGAAGGTTAADAVAPFDTVLLAAFEDGVLGDDTAELEDADQIGQLLDLDHPAGAIGDAIVARHLDALTIERADACVEASPFGADLGDESADACRDRYFGAPAR